MKSFPESDWKKLRALRDSALNRFCSRALEGTHERIANSDVDDDPHKTYLNVYRFLDGQDDELGSLFNDWRRSTALVTLTGWVQANLVKDEEFEAFTEQTKTSVKALINLREIS
jgi:hypothetical protein